jgi:hypothetical protein
MARIAVAALLVGGVALAAQQPAAPQKPAPEKKAETPPNPLDDLIAQALRNNPDILVAEAKVRESEAELQRTRVTTAQKVASLQASIEIARKVRDEAEQRYRTANHLFTTGRGATAEGDMRAANLAWERAIYEYVKLEGEMPALLGKMPRKLGQQKAEVDAGPKDDVAASQALRWLAVQRGVQLGERVDTVARLLAASTLHEVKAGPEGSIADRMRKALDKPIDIDVDEKALNLVLEKISEMLDKGITFRVAPAKPRDGATVFHATTLVSANFKNTPAGAVLQALNDTVPALAFVVRDYGVLVCEADSLPPDAVLLHRFWKSEKPVPEGHRTVSEELLQSRNEQLEALMDDVNARLSKIQANETAPGRVRGAVSVVDEKAGIVSISIDTDKGVTKGLRLHVFRLEPRQYVGIVRIEEVRNGEAVGKLLGKPRTAVKVGDRVIDRIE